MSTLLQKCAVFERLQGGPKVFTTAADFPRLAEFSVEVWIYWDGTAGRQVIVAHPVSDAPAAVGRGWALSIVDGIPSIESLGHLPKAIGLAPLPIKEWTHLAATYSQSTARLFIGGSIVGVFEPPQPGERPPPGTKPGRPGNFRVGTEAVGLRIGGEFASKSDDRFSGALRDLRIWSTPDLTEEIIRQFANKAEFTGHPMQTALAARWAMNETEGSTIADSTANKWTASGGRLLKDLRFATFNGASSAGIVADTGYPGKGEEGQEWRGISVEAWVFWDGSPGEQIVIGRVADAAIAPDRFSYSLYLSNGVPTWSVLIWGYVGGPNWRGESSPAAHSAKAGVPLAPFQWTHITGTFQGHSSDLYVSGVLADSRAGLRLPTGFVTEGGSYSIGKGFGGHLRDIRIWSCALSKENITQFCNVKELGSHPERARLMGAWRLDDEGGAFASDSSGYGQAGLMLDGAQFSEGDRSMFKTVDVTIENIPTWHCEDTVNLADYLSQKRGVGAVQIFARHVIVDRDIFANTTIATPPLELRIDCEVFSVRGDCCLDMSGIVTDSPRSSEGSKCLLDWASISPSRKRAQAGLTGLDGGSLTLNAFELGKSEQGVGVLTVLANGSIGGAGQDGYWGRAGIKGNEGVDGQFSSQGPSNGGPGEDGGDGGQGGDGGRGGTVMITLGDALGEPFTKSLFDFDTMGGKPGIGGAGGPPGVGGPPGRPAIVGDPPRTLSAEAGPVGRAGNQGPMGQPGDDGIVTVPHREGGVSSDEIRTKMNEDALPASLRTRVHYLLNKAVFSLMETMDENTFSRATQWLENRFTFPEISVRLTQIRGFLDRTRQLSGPQRIAAFESQRVKLRKDTTAAALGVVEKSTTAESTPSLRGLQDVLEGFLASVIQAEDSRVSTLPQELSPGNVEEDYLKAWSSIVKEEKKILLPPLAKAMAADAATGDEDLIPVAGEDKFSRVDEALAAQTMTPDALLVAAQEKAPVQSILKGLPLVIPAVILGYAVFQTVFTGYLISKEEEAARNRRQEEEERLRRYQELRNQVNVEYAASISKWGADNRKRKEQDAENGKRNGDESVRQERLRKNKRRKKDQDTEVKHYGTEFVGILDSLEPRDGEGGGFIAVFDGFLLPRISSSISTGLHILMARKISFILTAEVDESIGETLTPGQWYVVLVNYRPQKENASLEIFISVPYMDMDVVSGVPRQSQFLLNVPEKVPIRFISAIRLDSARATTLNLLFGLVEIDLIDKKSGTNEAFAKAAAVVVDRATKLEILNVGMASMHFITGPQTSALLAFDVGYGGPIGFTDEMETRLRAMADAWRRGNSAVIVLSHWDLDHYRGVTNINTFPWGQQIPFVGPAFGLRGPTILNLLNAIVSASIGRLCLVGTRVSAYANLLGPNCSLHSTLDGALQDPHIRVPANITLRSSTKAARAIGREYDKNNTETIIANIQMGAPGSSAGTMLLPGDACFTYVPAQSFANLAVLEATHHGSRKSIRPNNDIPQYSAPAMSTAGGIIYYSYGFPNGYNIDSANVTDLYSARGWSTPLRTRDLLPGRLFEIPLS